MSKYTKFKERQKNASPYANQAVCSKCVHCQRVRAAGFCYGFSVRGRKINSDTLLSSKESYCTQYYPKDETKEQTAKKEGAK